VQTIAFICKLSGIDPARYEEWRDSMSDEFFAAYCEQLSDENFQKLFYRMM
jgi:hypothetical protein